jgi:hypothetical protein
MGNNKGPEEEKIWVFKHKIVTDTSVTEKHHMTRQQSSKTQVSTISVQ